MAPLAILWRTTSTAELGRVSDIEELGLLIMLFPREAPTNSGTSICFLVHREYQIGDGTGWSSSLRMAKKMSTRHLRDE